jgi:hypothetical protein
LLTTPPNPSAHPVRPSAQLTPLIVVERLNYFITYFNRGESMHYIGKSKIGKQYLKPSITYPIIRLPLQRSEAIGTSIQIYKSEHTGQSIFVIIADNEDSESLKQGVALN